jgi:ATP-binding cassette subfamily B protein
MIRKLAGSIREFKTPTILTIVFIILEAIIESIIPFITANLVNGIKTGIDLKRILFVGMILIVLAVMSLASGGIAGFTCAKASTGFARNLRRDMFVNIQGFSFENVDKFSSSSLVTRLTTDINNVQIAFMMIIRIALRSPLMLIFSIIMAFYMGGKLAFSFVILIPILAIGLILIAKFAMPAFRRVFKKYDKLNESVEENVRAMRVVKGFAREEYEKEKFDTAADDIRIDFTKAERIVALNAPLMQLCMQFNMVFVMYIGAHIIITTRGESIDVGQLSAMLTYGFQILMSLMMFAMIYVMLTMSAESAKRIAEVLDEKSSLTSKEDAITEINSGKIEFKDVKFKYSKDAKKFALDDIDLVINSGETVGIIGGTGSSKSTLVQLIPRLYDVTEGQVLVDDKDVRDLDLEMLRDEVAMVLQKNLLFAGTIEENLKWGNPNATMEEIYKACEIAQASEFVNNFPEKFQTHIEQGGTNVSGGQKQRLCIARALLKKPKIIIFDDSTSAVDTHTDALIRKGLAEYMPETTKIVIAQRISSVQDADKIIVMENGHIGDVGTHEELLGRCEEYREIYEQQMSGGQEDE